MAKKKTDLTEVLTDDIAVRQAQSTYIGFFNQLPDPDPVLKKLGKSIEVYRDLTTDGHLFANIQQRKAEITSLLWELKQNDADDKSFEFIQKIFNRFDIDELIEQMLNAPLYGYSVLEVIWKNESGSIIPERIEEKPQEWFTFNNQNQLMLKTKAQPNGFVVPDYKFILVRKSATYDNPYGEKALSRCFWPVAFKRGGLRFWVTFTEKFGSPYIFGKLPRGAGKEQTTELLNILEKMVSDAIAVIPDDGAIEIKQASQSGSVDAYKTFLEFLNTEISKAILTQTLTTELQNKGSFAASETHSSMLNNVADSDAKLVQKAFNLLIKWIYTLNFGTEDNLPTFLLYEPEDVDKVLAERDDILTRQGLQFTAEYYKKSYNLTDDDFILSQKFPSDGGEGVVDKTLNPEFSEPKPDTEVNIPNSVLQMHIEQTLKPVFDLINAGSDFSEVILKLGDIYPNMKTDQLENLLTKVLFYSELQGRLDA